MAAGPGRRITRAARSAAVIASCAVFLLPAGIGAIALRGRRAASRHFYRSLVRQLQRLGPAFVKFGQIAATRRDLLPADLCQELGRLHDRVGPMTAAQATAMLRQAYGDDLERVFAAIEPTPLASGSIACVYRARRRGGGLVALKLQRPGIRRRMTLDLDILLGLSRFAERLPPVRGVPVGEVTGFLCRAVIRQLDFAVERDSLDRLAANLAGQEGVRIPRTVAELCRPQCLAMELVDGLDIGPIADIDPATRRALAAQTLNAVYQMLFRDGFVHCDLHRGNLYFAGSQVVILDAGFTVQLPPSVRRQFAQFFLGLAVGHGRQCGEVVVESALSVQPGADVETFVGRVADLVERNAGVPAREFQLIRFAVELFRLQRDFGLCAASEFVFPLMSLLVIEGTIRELDSDIDFQALAKPVLLAAIAASMRSYPDRRSSSDHAAR